jgi:CRP/FNR family cyclic AMP-dependent transcriptional regulator
VPRAAGLRLRGIALLEGLSPDRLDGIAGECTWRRYARDQQIVSREANDRDVYLIVSGRVRATTFSLEGREVSFRELSAGECFGEISAIDGGRRSVDVLAIEETHVASVTSTRLWALLRKEPIVAERMLRHLAQLVRMLSERVVDMSTLTVAQRVCAELIRLVGEADRVANVARLDPAPRHADIASRVGTYREQVSRELSALVRAGILRRDGSALLIDDVARLGHLAAENGGAARADDSEH